MARVDDSNSCQPDFTDQMCSADGPTPAEAQETSAAPAEHPPASQSGDTVEAYEPPEREELTDNRYVTAVKAQEKTVEDQGTEALEAADAYGRRADAIQEETNDKASSEWASGHYLSSIRTQVTGNIRANTERALQGANVAGAVAASVNEGILQLARGDEATVKRAAVGAAVGVAVAAAAPTGGASLEVAGVFTGITAGMTTYGVTTGLGEMARARDGAEFAKGAAKVAVSAMLPQIAKGVGPAVDKFMANAELEEPLVQWVTRFGGEMINDNAAPLSRAAAEAGAEAITHSAKFALEHLSAEAAEHILDDVIDGASGRKQ